jgi:hypothetical protein
VKGRSRSSTRAWQAPSDIRWLATIPGARATWKADERVAVVIDTDGVFLLHGAYSGSDRDRHMQEVRRADRNTLLRIDRRNRWLPQHDIARATLKQRPWTRAGIRSWTLTIEMVDGDRQRVFLVRDDHAALVREYLPQILGTRFVR